MRRPLALAAAVAALAATAALPASAATPKLVGTVGPGFTITLKQNGKPVRSPKAGTYRLTVIDRSSSHDYNLEQSRGGEFERRVTGVAFTGTRTITVRLTPGRWEFFCNPHESGMHGEFTVR